MSCCKPPDTRDYLRELLARRHDIAVFPADALDHDTPPDDMYFYRPAELLVPRRQVPLLLEVAARLGVRLWPLDDDGSKDPALAGPRCDDDDGEGSDDDEHPRPVRFVIGANAALDTLLCRLARASGGRLRVSPNHVLFACPRWKLSPDGDPQVAAMPRVPVGQPTWDLAVAVIDSGLPESYAANPLLAAVTVGPDEEEPWVYRSPTPVLTLPQGHGSFVAGLVRLGAPQAQVRSFMALDQDGVTDEWFLGHQVDLALATGAAVINLSLGAPSRNDESLLGLANLAAAAGAGETIVVAAAGNLGGTRPFWPAAEAWAIGVGAVELAGDGAVPVPASFTNHGPWVDVCALGVNVVSAYEAHPYRAADNTVQVFAGAAQWSGTSFATPRVAAAAATLLAGDPSLSRAGLLARFAAAGTAVAGLGSFVP